jgi:hypothetical protein
VSTTTDGGPKAAVPRRKIGWRRRVFVAVISLAVSLLLCEGALRVHAWVKYGSMGPDGVDDLMAVDREAGIRIPRPGYANASRNNSIRVNAHGFRGDEISVRKPPGTIRIACVGASTTFCIGATSNEAAWPHQLEERLRRKYPGRSWQVINAGVPGHRMKDCVINLRKRVLPFEPDLVIFYEANNQLANDTFLLARGRGLVSHDSRYLSPTTKYLAHHSMLFRLCHLSFRILTGGGGGAGKLNGLPEDLPARYVEGIAQMHDELRRRNIPLVLSAFFTKYRPDQERAVRIRNADVSFYYMPWASIDDLVSGMAAYNKALVRYAHEHGVPVAEEVTSIPADSTHFMDAVHLADAGCARFADRMFHFLEQRDLVRPLMARGRPDGGPDF